jgi:hypothetical protein
MMQSSHGAMCIVIDQIIIAALPIARDLPMEQ